MTFFPFQPFISALVGFILGQIMTPPLFHTSLPSLVTFHTKICLGLKGPTLAGWFKNTPGFASRVLSLGAVSRSLSFGWVGRDTVR